MAENTTQRALLFLLRETIGDIVVFPIWWFSTGLTKVSTALYREWIEVEEWLSLRILVKNIFRPMFAEYSKTGRLISFFLRLFLITTRGIVLLIWTIVELLALLLWIGLPLLALGLFIRQLIPTFNG
jgi:hypothetical protein